MYGISGLCSSVVSSCNVRFSSNKSTKKLLEFLADMPKVNSARIAEAQRQRQNILKKSDKYAPSTVYLQVIGSGARGAPNTLYLFTDQKRYLFNCGECTQRLAHEHKVKLSKLDHIFVTSKTWKNIGGLPGLSLTLQDVGVPNITLHGPEGLDELYNATRRFVVMKDMKVTMEKCYLSSRDFEDNALTVKYVLLGPHDSIISYDKPAAKRPKLENADKEFEEFIHDDTDYYKSTVHGTETSSSNMRKEKTSKPKDKDAEKAEKLSQKTERVLHNLERRSACTVAYICTLKKRMGTLDLAKCVEMGVKPGPILGQLKNGQDVVLPDGTLVLSKDVKTPDDPGPVFIVMEVPDLSYLKESEFADHFDNGLNPPEKVPTLIVHLTPPQVFNHPTYRAFMKMFGSSTRHLVVNSQNSCLGSEAVHRTQHKLNLLDSEIFPLLKDASVPAVWNSSPTHNSDSPTRRGLEELKNRIAVAQFQNIINMEGSKGDSQSSREEGDKPEVITARTLTMFQLRPKKHVDRSAEPKLHIQEYMQEAMNVDGFVSSLEQFKRMVENMRYARLNSQREYPKVVFLGTGSCIPSKTRNTSAIMLQINENQSMLMDCGEGTFGQLVRFYGPKKVNSFLRTLTAIYVSHLHADHHIGLIGVLQARREAFQESELPYEPLYLLAPGQIITWLSVYDHQFERIKSDFTLIPNQNILMPLEHQEKNPTTEQPPHDISPAILASIGVQGITTCLVNHCPNAFGVAIDIDGTNKLTYSGDTIPSDALVQLGKDSTLLIHEATMEDELADEARIKMHSTTSQAIEIGQLMNARYTLLTHFSQRYARLPRLNAHILNDNKTVGIAFDNMQISMGDLELLPHMYAPLQLMFAEHCVEMEMKAMNRARHKQRAQAISSPDMPKSEVKPRRVSPGCRTISSVPTSNAIYRETNASRLRQEIKGMAVSGFIRKGRRSTSSSPSKKKSSNSSPTRSLNSDCSSPKRKVSERTIELGSTPHTMSETSNSSRDVHDKNKTGVRVGHNGLVYDSRSKTKNTTSPSTDKVLYLIKAESHKHKKDWPLTAHMIPSTNIKMNNIVSNSSIRGYGKPLVTPMNKKLSIRRDSPSQDVAPTAKEFSHIKMKPSIIPKPTSTVITRQPATKPIVTRLSARRNEVSQAQPKVDTMTSVLIHLIMWRVAHIASCLYWTAWPCAMALTALGIVFWTATMETPATAKSTNGDVSSVKKLDVRSRNVVKPQRPMSAMTSRFGRMAEERSNNNSTEYKPNITSVTNRYKAKPLQLAGPVPKVTSVRPSLTRIPLKIHSENNIKQRKCSTEKLKQQFCRDMPVYAAGRPNSPIHSSTRTFKPQLEDIKSSYLLLNKKDIEHEKKLKAKANALVDKEGPGQLSRKVTTHQHQQVGETVVVHEPRVLSEYERKEQLNKIKQKFKSRGFIDDSRYEKIEGLNWISWKG